MSPKENGARIIAVWEGTLDLLFSVSCLWFIFGIYSGPAQMLGANIVLCIGGVLAGWIFECRALLAFTIAFPVVSGAYQTGLLPSPASLLTLFSSCWIGLIGTRLFRRRVRRKDYPRISQAELIAVWILNALASITFVSLGVQLCRLYSENNGFEWSRNVNPGFGSSSYVMLAGFVWLQGIFYARSLIMGTRANEMRISVRWFFSFLALAMTVFCLIQYIWDIPEGWIGAGYQSPFEDLSSFGSFAVVLLVFYLTSTKKLNWYSAIGVAWLLTLLIASWSRASWLAGAVFLVVIASIRLRVRNVLAVFGVLIASFIAINATSDASIWKTNNYAIRLLSLVKLESLDKKDSGRFSLYHRAAMMIRAHPLTGFGVGSFYLTGVKFSSKTDALGGRPEFAHNVFLQLAAEQGIPTALILVAGIALTVTAGLKAYRRLASAAHSDGSRITLRDPLILLALVLTLLAYIETQFTANSLNIYITHQFLFWFLVASIWSLSRPRTNSAL